MKHLNYCFKDSKNNSGRARAGLIRSRSLQFILSPLTVSLKNPSLLNLLSVRIFSFLRRYFITFFMLFFRGKEKFREEREWTEKLWFTLLQIRLIFSAICHERKKNNKFWGFGVRAGEIYRINMIEIWKDFAIFSPSLVFCCSSISLVSYRSSSSCK